MNSGRGAPAARFGIAHELGHFLLERHVLGFEPGLAPGLEPGLAAGLDGVFTCTRIDLRETRTARRHQRQEAEANAFAIGLLVPAEALAPALRADPSIAVAADLRTRLEISLEAAMRCLVDRHDEPIAAIWTWQGVIRYLVRGAAFPWIDRSPGSPVAPLSLTARALATGGTGTTQMREVAPAAWTRADIPELFEQVRVGADGHTLTLLWATLSTVEGGDQDG